MKIKVTHIVRQYLPSVGGMEEVVRNIAMHQIREGYETKIITLNRLFRNAKDQLPAREIIDGIEVVRLPYYGSSRYPLCPSILGQLRGTDVVHVHGVDFFYDFLAATKWIHRLPLILSTHGGFFHTRFASRVKQTYFNTITRLCSSAYSSVIATSANDGELFSQIMTTPKLQVIENGVDIKKFANQAAKTLAPNLIYFGRWSSNKGLLESLELFSVLKSRDDSWHFTIAGREYDHSLSELQTLVKQMDLENNVTLVANPTEDQLRELLQNASYYLCLSQHEGFGIAAIEAMSAGLTPLLSDIPPFQKLFTQSQLGFTVNASDDHNTIVETLLNLHAQGNAAYTERRTHAMKFAAHYAWPKVADEYLALYEKWGKAA